MNNFGLAFHHLGLAVHKSEAAASFLKGLGYAIGPEIFDPLQNVRLRMCTSQAMPDVEVISPGEGETPIDTFLSLMDGLVYHTCYVSENVTRSVEQMKAQGSRIICVSSPKPAILFDHNEVSFYNVVGFGLIEIIQA